MTATQSAPTRRSSLLLERDALTLAGEVVADLPMAALVEEAIRNGEGVLAETGPLITRTGRHTGRSPQDRYVVDEPSTRDAVWWGPVNQPMSEEAFALLERRIAEHLKGRRIYVRHGYVGAHPRHRRALRVITETAWHNLFAHHLFLRPRPEELPGFQPQFTILDLPTFRADPAELGVRSETVIVLHFARNLLIVGGSAYAGEMKKGIFTVMNFLLPDEGVLPMHCAANVGRDGDVALFFGLSGTGKTSLSTVSDRLLVGDDEHGWGSEGIFNFEGGCYAKLIRLRPEAEPEIYATTRRFGTIAENVVYDPATRRLDLDSEAITENTRGAYPLEFLPNVAPSGMAGHPRHVLLLAADAFGVLPPVARLSVEQALYHFLSGYTAKLAGTEVGVSEPKATFSACFGAPFMPRHPGLYARMLGERLRETGAQAWLINTGWTEGPVGVGHRISIAHTRAAVRAIVDGALDGVEYDLDPVFGFEIPRRVPGVPPAILRPRETWADGAAYDAQAARLARMFAENFATLADQAPAEAFRGGPVATR
jgi:phosphoenolpyruvate carboxykinase (ATP)